jgi:hypothetical protein
LSSNDVVTGKILPVLRGRAAIAPF